jgi:hypothetical protein
MHLGRPGVIPLSQNGKTYICFHLIVLRNVNLKYIYEINQVKTKFYVLSLYVVYHTPIEKFEDTKGVIRSHQSNKTDNDLQNSTKKTKDWATRTPLKPGDEHMCSGRLSSSCTSTAHPVIVKRDTSLLLLISCRTTIDVNKYNNVQI